MTDQCHCGKPLHYTNPFTQAEVTEFVRHFGPFITIVVDGKPPRAWRVQRHYLALHGIKAAELPDLGFLEVKP
jgi:hypothetical protein